MPNFHFSNNSQLSHLFEKNQFIHILVFYCPLKQILYHCLVTSLKVGVGYLTNADLMALHMPLEFILDLIGRY